MTLRAPAIPRYRLGKQSSTVKTVDASSEHDTLPPETAIAARDHATSSGTERAR